MLGVAEGELQRRVGRHLLAYRKKHDLSQEAMADLLGVHRPIWAGSSEGNAT